MYAKTFSIMICGESFFSSILLLLMSDYSWPLLLLGIIENHRRFPIQVMVGTYASFHDKENNSFCNNEVVGFL